MNRPFATQFYSIAIAALLLCVGSLILGDDSNMTQNKTDSAIVYPSPRQTDAADDYFGTRVADPYRWMEEEGTPELNEWIQAENRITEDYLAKIPFRETLRDEITKRFNYEKYSLPFKKGGRYFYFKNSGLQNQPVLWTTTDWERKPTLLLDPNTLSEDGTVSLAAYAVSKNGQYLAYSVSRSGSDWEEAFVLNIETGETLADHLKWLKFTDLVWAGDGFYYCRFPAPEEGKSLSGKNEFHQVWFHRVGTEQSEDVFIYGNEKEPERTYGVFVDLDENYLFLSETESTYGNRLFYRDLRNPESDFVTLYSAFDAETYPLGVYRGQFYLITDYNAPRRRVVAVNPSLPSPESWREVVAESDSLLKDAGLAGDKIAVIYLKDAACDVRFMNIDGSFSHALTLPALGVVGFSGEKGDDELFYSFTSFVYPTQIYRYDLTSRQTTLLFGKDFPLRPEDYVTTRVWFTSKDGTRAPLFLVYKKGIQRNGENPTLLHGYGGFNINMTPAFKPERTVFLDHGGILAVAVLRGGGEYGEEWHKAGTKLQKQNVFDDFIAAAEFLIRERWTSSKHLAIEGRSNGGLLVGAAMTQRPDLFQAAIPAVGVLDMLRYHKFTIGWAWAVDYGTSDESPEMFRYLYGYSPLHRIQPGTSYPATLVLTSDHDDRVVPAHSFKFGATLQAANGGPNPILIRIESNAGHGHGKPLSKTIQESADVYSFVLFHTLSPKSPFFIDK